MEIDAILCNHAETQNNLLYVSGGGIEFVNVPPGLPAPYLGSLGIGIVLTVPWTQTNRNHSLTIDLISEDGQPIRVPTGPDTTIPISAKIDVNVGRPPHLQPGDDQRVCAALNIPQIPLPAIGKYLFSISLDGNEMRRLPFRVQLLGGAFAVAR